MQITSPLPAKWDAFVEARSGHLLQTASWGMLKSDFGWQHEIIGVENNRLLKAGALVLHRKLPAKLGTISYVPRGPIVDWNDAALVQSLIAALDKSASNQNSILLKLEPDLWDDEGTRAMLGAYGFQVSKQTVQPPSTVTIDITSSEEDILARMSQSTRRKVRLPYRRDISFRQGRFEDIDSFGQLIDTTGDRDNFGVHSTAYYQRAFDLFAPEHCVLLLASFEETDVAGLMAFSMGTRSWYLYGASSNHERNRMSTYGIQLEAIRWAKAKGCGEYDLWGIPDETEETLEAQFKERRDGLWGVYGFKRGFGGNIKKTVGAWDKVYRPMAYLPYQMALKARGILSSF